MLCLSRKKHESIRIGKDIVITVLELRTDKCRIGIAAPKEVLVLREELWDESQGQQDQEGDAAA